jgi:signal transduction histidine kinase
VARPDEPQRLLPSLRLDELLDELQVRLQAVLSTRDRVHALLEAVVAVGSSLELEVLLRSIVQTAVSLVDAKYGAMGVLGESGKLADFIPVGLTREQIGAIHHWPEGKGLLGLLITDPSPLRIDNIAEHPASFGFPDGHPAMRSFLGVPIRIHGEVYGNLYLTEKIGGGTFDSEDEAVAGALAAAAGVAIENARLYEDARQRQHALSAVAEVTRLLLSGAEAEDALEMITRKALDITGADLVFVTLPTPDGRNVRVEHAAGKATGQALGLEVPVERSLSGLVLSSGEPLTIADLSTDERVDASARDLLGLGPGVVVPLAAPGGVRGVLVAARTAGRPPLPQSATDLLVTFAAAAAIALTLAEHRRQAEQMAVFEDRDRIARDLHDLVIQRLYATGMSLQGATALITSPDVAERVSQAVDGLDDTIREIRSTIFALQAHPEDQQVSLRARILFITQEMAGALGFTPSLRLDGILDTAVPERVAEPMLTALREALSNVARHAKASRVEVIVEVDHDLALTVRDNGVGITRGGRRSGLRNLEQRAADLGGSITVRPGPAGRGDGAMPGGPDGPGRGTELVWRVPLHQRAQPAGNAAGGDD